MSTKWQEAMLYYTMLTVVMAYIPAAPGTSTLGGYSRTPGQHGRHRSFLQQCDHQVWEYWLGDSNLSWYIVKIKHLAQFGRGFMHCSFNRRSRYLTGRSFNFPIGNFGSDKVGIPYIVPQGSRLGPLPFHLYTLPTWVHQLAIQHLFQGIHLDILIIYYLS